ncbi:MAG: TauD/TfdA family dioxygenase [Actinomycetota bacterium]
MDLRFEPLDAPLGAQVLGFDPSASAEPIDATAVAALGQALVDHSVLVFRGAAISPADLVALGRAFGQLEILPEPEKRHPDHPEIFNLTNVRPDGDVVERDEPQAVFLRGTERWHTDSSFRAVPSLCTMLYAVEVPDSGGETEFADMYRAFDELPGDLRVEVTDRRLIHSYAYSRANNPGELEPMSDEELAQFPPVSHPLVRQHPDGRCSLYLGGHVAAMDGVDDPEGRERIDAVLAHATQERFVYQHRWQANDLVVWDNRSTLHRLRPYDIAGTPRVMRRITVAGNDAPVPASGPVPAPAST